MTAWRVGRPVAILVDLAPNYHGEGSDGSGIGMGGVLQWCGSSAGLQRAASISFNSALALSIVKRSDTAVAFET